MPPHPGGVWFYEVPRSGNYAGHDCEAVELNVEMLTESLLASARAMVPVLREREGQAIADRQVSTLTIGVLHGRLQLPADPRLAQTAIAPDRGIARLARPRLRAAPPAPSSFLTDD